MYSRLLTIIAASAAVLLAGLAEAPAATGTVQLRVVKGGVVIGGTNGTGILRFRRHSYPLVISGVGCCINIGGSEALLTGQIANIRRPTDIEGQYSAAGAGLTIGQGEQAITLTNPQGAVLQLRGPLAGLMLNLDLGGMTIVLARPGRMAAAR